MKNMEEAKNITAEIAGLLSNATQDQKILIKGILIGAVLPKDMQDAHKEAADSEKEAV